MRRSSGANILAGSPCDLARLTIEVVREAGPACDRQLRIDLGYEGAEAGAPGVVLDGNPTLLKELVRNLLDNAAINYTPSSTRATARVSLLRGCVAVTFGRIVVVQVEDNGPGIPRERRRELVFEPFYRVLGNEADGSGLGLPIVREIARQHFATVRLEDAHPGQNPPGTLVSLRFDGNESRKAHARQGLLQLAPPERVLAGISSIWCRTCCCRRCGSRSPKRAG